MYLLTDQVPKIVRKKYLSIYQYDDLWWLIKSGNSSILWELLIFWFISNKKYATHLKVLDEEIDEMLITAQALCKVQLYVLCSFSPRSQI